ncbi:reverse transcriptase domain-containing protein [Tanacetum coccineum]
MFNSTLIGAARVWFDELPPKSIDSYKDLKAAFLAYFMQQKKHVKDPVEIHNIKQKYRETFEEFMERFKVKTGHSRGDDDYDHGFYTGRNRGRVKKESSHPLEAAGPVQAAQFLAKIRLSKPTKGWTGIKQVHPLNRTPKEIFVAESERFKPPPPMVTPADKRSNNKFCEFHNDKGHNTDECMQLKKQIEELVNKITFPSLSANKGTEGPLVIEAEIGGHVVYRMYVDGGSSMEVLYEHCFNQIRPEIKSQMVSATTSLTDFNGETIWPLGQLWLLVTIGDAEHFIKAWMNFMIVRSPSPYNGIIGRPGIREIQAVPSTAHGILQFPVDGRVVTIRSTILTPNECATIMTTSKDSMKKIKGGQENLKVAIHYYFQDQEVALGGTLSIKGRMTLCGLLKRNLDIFAWKPSDIIGAEVQKLVKAGIMHEVYYHDWSSNLVMVKKHDGSWRMCVDFTNLNRACPQDCYPLSEIDWKVESLCGYPFKCFLDAYKGYHQIQMAEKDEEKMAFHTPHRVYCYTKIPLGLKNVGAMYQQLVDKAFEKQVGQNLEVYVDDLVIKSHKEAKLLRDIEETFCTL